VNGWVAYLVVGCLVVVAAVALAVAAAHRSRARRRAAARDVPRADPRRIRPGDVVEIRQVSYSVRGTIRLVEVGWSWIEHLIEDADGVRRRLSIEEDRKLELVLWDAEPAAALTPGAPTIEFAGRRYDWMESGQARYTTSGSTGLDPSGTMRYHDYQAPGGARLTFEAYGEAGWEVARGELLHLGEILVHPSTARG
jgi:hypothetical protein